MSADQPLEFSSLQEGKGAKLKGYGTGWDTETSADGARNGWGVNISPGLFQESMNAIRLGKGSASQFCPPLGRVGSWYLKDGGHGFIEVIIVTWLLDKDVS